MKICLHIICVLPHSDIEFERKNQFCKYVKNYPKFQQIKGLTQFSDNFKHICKINVQKKIPKVFITE